MIVPGVADATRARTTVRNLDHLQPRSCIVFTHKRCGDDPQLDRVMDVGPRPPLAMRCDVYRAPNGKRGGYVQHLKRVLPLFVEAQSYSYVLILLDDVDATRVRLPRMLSVIEHNQLSWASPSVDGAHDSIMERRNASALAKLGTQVRSHALRAPVFAISSLKDQPSSSRANSLARQQARGLSAASCGALRPFCG